MNEYKSVEKRLEEKILAPIGRGVYKFASGYYGAVATPLRIPTVIRKALNKELKYTGRDFENSFPLTLGNILGVITDLAVGLGVSSYAHVDNYVPIAIITGTNLASGIFELGRLKTSKEEYRLAHAEKTEPLEIKVADTNLEVTEP